MLAAEAAAADGQKLLSPVAPAMMRLGRFKRRRWMKIRWLTTLRFEIRSVSYIHYVLLRSSIINHSLEASLIYEWLGKFPKLFWEVPKN